MKKIAINYIFFGRFIVDLLSVIPFEEMIPADGTTSNKQFKLFGLFKLIRLLRLGRIISFMKFRQSLKVGFRLFLLFFFFFLLVHWIACLW